MNNRPKSRVSVAPAIVAAGGLGDGWAGAWRDREYFRGQAGRQSDIRPHLFDHLSRGDKQSLRYREAERFGSLEIDH